LNMKLGAKGFIAIKEGRGERLEERPELNHAKFLFSYWKNDEFKKVLSRNNYHVLHEGYIPMSPMTNWLTYHVRTTKKP
jgi:hypothetical protein